MLFNNYIYPSHTQSSPQALAAAVLAEVPSQLVEYMTEHRMTPMNRTQ